MMCRRLTSFGDSQEGGRTSSASTALWRTAGRYTIIRAERHGYWRRAHEGEKASQGKPTAQLCRGSGTCLAPGREGRSEDGADVRHAALCLGEWKGGGEETMSGRIVSARWSTRVRRHFLDLKWCTTVIDIARND